MAPMLTKETGRVDFARRRARGARSRARLRSVADGLHACSAASRSSCSAPRSSAGRGAPGVVIGADRDGLLVGCGDDAVAFAELQLPGKKRMSATALLAGRPMPVGTQLGA